ncbi:EPM2A-interacting protein 1-like [Podarcis raffonei]|uniref:EPM2A-interacting protein 1-like n=1 Tax=Podarcis raffonei TaxID=65483 RepID=UPI0023292820|nr:EPM2A-interacting protein 1-like [Podarcis raffonei]
MSKKRKVDAEGRQFQERWESEYMFVINGDKPVCLICYEAVAVMKEYNLRRHFETKHGAKFANLSHQEKQQKVQELKGSLYSQRNIFAKMTAKNDAAVKASYLVAEEIARASKCFSEGAFVKQCMLKVCEQSYRYNRPFEGDQTADAAPDEFEFDTPVLDGLHVTIGTGSLDAKASLQLFENDLNLPTLQQHIPASSVLSSNVIFP